MQQNWDTNEGPGFTDALFGAFETKRDAIDFLTDDHREVEDLFDQIENSTGRAYQSKAKLIETVCEKLTLHAKLEEKYFYPLVLKIDEKAYYEAQEEHQAVKNLIKRLKNVRGNEDDLAAKVKFLKELVKHHVEEEESQMFPEVKRQVDQEKLVEIAEEMQDVADRSVPAEPRKAKHKAKKKRKQMAMTH